MKNTKYFSEKNTKNDIKNGNKLPTYYDDPIDLFYKKYIDKLNPHFKKARESPHSYKLQCNNTHHRQN